MAPPGPDAPYAARNPRSGRRVGPRDRRGSMRKLLALPLLALALAGAGSAPVAARTAPSDPAKAAALDAINRFRRQNSRPALGYNVKRESAARWLATDLSHKGHFSHRASKRHHGSRAL